MKTEEELQEKVDEAQEKLDEIEEQSPDSEGAQEDIESLKSELVSARQEIEKWQKEAKAHQSTATKKSQEAQNLRNQEARINALDAKLDIIAEIIEEQRTTEDYEEKPQRKPSYRDRIQNLDKPQVNEQEQRMREYAQEIKSILPEGVRFDEDDRFENAYLLFMAGKYDKAVKKTKEIVDKMAEENSKEKTQEDERAKEIAALKEEIEKLKGVKSGKLKSETGLPSGAAVNKEQIKKNYRENPGDPKAFRAYHQMMQEEGG